jgi:hypothetical protein
VIWADIIDFLTMWPEERRKVARLLGEIKAAEQLRRAGRTGERRGTRPLFASPP